MTTLENIKLDQIQALSTEAAQAGDTDTVRDCEVVAASYDEMFVNTADCGILGSVIPYESWEAAQRIVAIIRNAEAQF